MPTIIPKTKPFAMPKTLAGCVDQMYKIRETRLELQRSVDALAAFERQLETRLVDELPADDATGAIGKLAEGRVTVSTIATVEDWPAFYSHIKRTDSFDLLNKAINQSSVRERWDAGKAIPGTGKFIKKKMSITKRK